MWCWRRLLRVPWTARRSNQSILKEISPNHSLAGLMLKLKLQYFGHLMRRTDSFEKTLMLGKNKGRRGRGQQEGWDGWMVSPTQWTWVWVNSVSWHWTGRPGMLYLTGSPRVRHDWATELNCNIFEGFPGGSDGKESACNAQDLGSIPGLRRSTGEGHGNPLLYSCLENSKNRGAWWATVHGVTNSQTQLSNSHFSLGHIYSTNIYQCLQCISHYT